MTSENQKKIQVAIIYFLDKGFTERKKIINAVEQYYNFDRYEIKKAMNRMITNYKKKLAILK